MKRILYLLLFLSAVSSAQTTQYLAIPGTRVQLSPPAAYKVAESFFGLQKDARTGIQVYEVVGKPVMNAFEGFTRTELEAQGATVYDYREIMAAGYDARYAVLQGDSITKVASLVFGDSTFTVTLIAAYSITDSTLQQQVEKCLLTVKYNKQAKVDRFAISYFKLDDKNSKYKYVKTTNENMHIYALDGIKGNYMAEPSLTAMSIHLDSTTVENVGKGLLEDMKKYGLNEVEITYKSTKPVNGYDTYETIAYGNVAKEKHVVYHLVVAKGKKAFIVQGIAQRDYEVNVQEFEKLAHTIIAK